MQGTHLQSLVHLFFEGCCVNVCLPLPGSSSGIKDCFCARCGDLASFQDMLEEVLHALRLPMVVDHKDRLF